MSREEPLPAAAAGAESIGQIESPYIWRTVNFFDKGVSDELPLHATGSLCAIVA
jgi:hypothetical protein